MPKLLWFIENIILSTHGQDNTYIYSYLVVLIIRIKSSEVHVLSFFKKQLVRLTSECAAKSSRDHSYKKYQEKLLRIVLGTPLSC